MTLFWIAQIIGGIAFLVGITMFFNRNERRFKFQLAGYSTIMCVHFFMLGANAAGMSVLLSAIRTVVSIWWRNVWIMVLFIILPLLFAATRVKHPIEFLPVMGAMVSTCSDVSHQRPKNAQPDVVLHRLLGDPQRLGPLHRRYAD